MVTTCSENKTLLKKVKFSPELITLTLDLYFSGLSLRKVASNINDQLSIDINFSTIYTWIQRYIPAISNYVNSLKPQLGNEWHADELFVKMKGGEKRKANSRVAYLWNIMNRESRFLIASKLSEQIEDLVIRFILVQKGTNRQKRNYIRNIEKLHYDYSPFCNQTKTYTSCVPFGLDTYLTYVEFDLVLRKN
jgi:hypothetical protein